MSKDIPQTPKPGRKFWIMGGALAVLLVATTGRDIARPFDGLHSWGQADGPWFARCHVRYGLAYTRGLKTQAVGDPPPANPQRYVNHPQLGSLIAGLTMLVLGVNTWAMRVVSISFGVLALLLLLRILRSLCGDRTAILAGLLWIMFPITGYFGAGGSISFTGFLAFWFYLVLIGEIKDGPEPKKRHLVGLAVVLLVMTQLAWNCYFWAMAIGVHYVFRCIRRRRWPRWPLLAVLIAAPLAGALMAFLIMLVGFDWDFQRIVDLYTWRAAKGEMTARMKEFDWIAWFERFWQYALTNFTFWVLLAAMIGIGQHVVRLVADFVGDRARGRPSAKGGEHAGKGKAAAEG
ncbi:MAG: glycosyltransferase family 39 protein, partial [Phycisphaerae bacterium]